MGEQGVDLVRRDPNDLNTHVKVAFEDIFGEPDGTHSIDCIWETSYMCFTGSKNCCYKLLTTLCGLCIALHWGCTFAQITFDQVWLITPGLRVCAIYAGCCQKYIGIFVQCCMAPICETCGLCFSKITVTNK